MRSRLLKIGLIAFFALSIGLWLDYRHALYGELDLPSPIRLTIPPGGGARGVIDQLEAAGLCDRPTYLLFNLWSSGRGRQLKAGVYAVQPGMSLDALITAIAQGDTDRAASFVLREGVNIFDLAAQLEAHGLSPADAFLSQARSATLTQSLSVPALTFEGYLFPATYTFPPNASPEDILRTLHAQFQKIWSNITREHAAALSALKAAYNLSDHQVLTLASLVEKEAAVASERAVIARVFLNRLKIKKKLETDPTCVYPPLKLGEKPSPSRCRDPQSAYSTYVIPGLPPGPISSVGEASIKALLDPYDGPAADALLYFAARYDGSRRHYFSSDAEEHQQAVEHFLKKNPKISAPNKTPQPPP